MTYATGSATTIPNLMDAMSTFAQANTGMTETIRRTETIKNRANVNESMTVICLTKGTSRWWFAYGATDVQAFLADGATGTVWFVTGGVQAPSVSRLWPIAPPFTSYHLFTEGTVVHLAIEMSSGAWTHLNFGDITKYGTWTGGSYIGVVNAETNISSFFGNANSAGINGLFGEIGASPFGTGHGSTTGKIRIVKGTRNYGNLDGASTVTVDDAITTPVTSLGFTSGVIDTLTRDTPNVFNNRVTGPRLEVFVSDAASIFAGGTGLWLPIGFIPNIRIINIALLNPKDVVNTDWMTFPIQAKTGLAANYASTFNNGWAVRK